MQGCQAKMPGFPTKGVGTPIRRGKAWRYNSCPASRLKASGPHNPGESLALQFFGGGGDDGDCAEEIYGGDDGAGEDVRPGRAGDGDGCGGG